MPEIPDLEIISEVLDRRIVGQTLTEINQPRPLALRNLAAPESVADLTHGQEIVRVQRFAKFLIWSLGNDVQIVINLMLAGHLRFVDKPQVLKRDYVRWLFAGGQEIRLNDTKGMAKVYITRNLDAVPGYAELGPDALDPAFTEEAFLQRLHKYRGEIKGVLTRGACVSGIGNAYADEILFRAGIYPFRKRTSLSQGEQRALYQAMHSVIADAVVILRERMGERIDLKLRDFLAIHGKKGEPCPVCGGQISEVNVRKRMTNFCRTCQPGSMFR